jgi:hypothetical protein
MVFDVKHDGHRKSRLVAQGDKVLVPTEDVYSGMVGIETIRLAMVLAFSLFMGNLNWTMQFYNRN